MNGVDRLNEKLLVKWDCHLIE